MKVLHPLQLMSINILKFDLDISDCFLPTDIYQNMSWLFMIDKDKKHIIIKEGVFDNTQAPFVLYKPFIDKLLNYIGELKEDEKKIFVKDLTFNSYLNYTITQTDEKFIFKLYHLILNEQGLVLIDEDKIVEILHERQEIMDIQKEQCYLSEQVALKNNNIYRQKI